MTANNFSKLFSKYKRKQNENNLPSNLIPLEIERWELYRDLVTKRGFKTLSEDKKELLEYLVGDTFPMARAYESHPMRHVKLNPTYDYATKSFPLWENIYRIANCIGTSYEQVSVRAGLRAAIKDLIDFLKTLDLDKLDHEVKTYEKRLKGRRSAATYKAISGRRYLKNYPNPR